MPQLDISVFAPQIVWLAITFVAMYILMAKVALPRVAQVLEERQARIDDNLAKAQELKKDAEEAAVAYEKALADARADAQLAVREVSDRVAQQTAKAQEELSAKISSELKAAEASIAAAKDAAMANLKQVAQETAQAAVSKLGGLDLDDAAVAAAINNAMQERN